MTDGPTASDSIVRLGAVALAALLVAGGAFFAGVGLPAADRGTASSMTPTPDPQPSPTTAGTSTTPGSTSPSAPLAESNVTIVGERGDELGYTAAVGDVNGDGVRDLAVGAPLRNSTAVRAGAVFLFYGPLDADELTPSDADATLVGESGGDWAGNSVAVADVDADGADDLVVGAPLSDAGGTNAGAVYLVRGGSDLGGTISLVDADARLVGDGTAFAGYSVDAANVTGGPGADVLVGAPLTSLAGPESGAAYLVSGASLGETESLAGADAVFVGAGANDRAGWSVAIAGDANDDGRADLLVGAPKNDTAGEDAGAAYLVTDRPFSDRLSLADAVTLRGATAGGNAGYAVAAAGDVNDDGVDDVLVGAPLDSARAHHAGAVSVVHGSSTLPAAVDLSDADGTLVGESAGDRAGWSVGRAGDADGDGAADVLVGAPGNDAGGSDAGAVYLVAAPDAGTEELRNATVRFPGQVPGGKVGRVDRLPAIDRGDATGVIVAAPFADPTTVRLVYVDGDPDGA